MGSVRRGGMKSRALILDFFLLLPAVALAAEPAVEVEVDAEKRSFTRGELLAQPRINRPKVRGKDIPPGRSRRGPSRGGIGPINWESLGASFRLPCVGPSLP